MRYLADTNILLRSSEPAHPAHSDTVTATQLLLRRGDTLHAIAQNLIEFWNVATRPANGDGLGMTISETQAELVHIGPEDLARNWEHYLYGPPKRI
jgi:hypothetical protein